MKKPEKLEVIRWYINRHCGFYDASLLMTEDLRQLEKIVREDRLHEYNSTCSSCKWGEKDYNYRCQKCIYSPHGTCEIDGYIFPYDYWKKFKELLGE